jgi:ascorbate-specific PTS system EIIC-type component UlaA
VVVVAAAAVAVVMAAAAAAVVVVVVNTKRIQKAKSLCLTKHHAVKMCGEVEA